MSRQQGLFPFSANFEPRIASPLDSRLVANLVSDLTDGVYWTSSDGGIYLYKGISVTVWNDTADNNGVYVLIDDDYTDINNWLKIGAGDISSIETGAGLTVSNNNGTYSISILDTSAGDGLTFSNGIYSVDLINNSGLTFSNGDLTVLVDNQTVFINSNGELSSPGSGTVSIEAGSGLTVSNNNGTYSISILGTSAGQGLTFSNGVFDINWGGTASGLTFSNDALNILVDNQTVFINGNGELSAVSSGGTVSIEVGPGLTVSNFGVTSSIDILVDNETVFINNDGELSAVGGTFSIETGPGLTVSNFGLTSSVSILDTTGGEGLTFSNGVFDINWGGTFSGLTFSNDALNVVVDNETIIINENGAISASNSTYYKVNNFSNLDSIVISSDVDSQGNIYIFSELGTRYGETTGLNRLVKLNPDGTLNQAFTHGTGFNGGLQYLNSGLHVNSDDTLFVWGYFTQYNGQTCNRIVKLNSDGTIDTSFSAGTAFNAAVSHVYVDEPNQALYCIGNFTQYNGNPRNRIVKLNFDGSIDNTFDVGTGLSSIGGYITEIDGDIFVGGAFSSYNGNSSPRYVRINKANGAFDPSFVSQGNNGPGSTTDYIKEYNGKVLIYGGFTTYGGQPLSRIGLLNLDGTIDTSFNVGKGIRRPIDNDTPSGVIFVRDVFIDSDNTLLVTCQNPLQLYDDTWVGELIRLDSTGAIVNNYTEINHKIQHLLKIGTTYYAASYDSFDPEGYGDFSFSPLDFRRGAIYEYKGYKLKPNGQVISSSNLDEDITEFETNFITERDVKGEIKKYLNLLEFPEGISNVAVGPGLTVSGSGTYSTISIDDSSAGDGLTFSNGIYSVDLVNNSGLTFSNGDLTVLVDGVTVIINGNGQLTSVGGGSTTSTIPQYQTTSGDILATGLTISGTVSYFSRLQVFINGLEEPVGLSSGTGANLPIFTDQSVIFDSGVLTWNDSGAGYILDSNDEVRILYGS